MGVWCSLFFCALEYFIKITKQRDNKENETKKTSEFPNMARLQWWDGASPEHWVTISYFSSPTLEILPQAMVGSQASCWAVDGDSGLEPSCSWACYLYLAFLLPLSSTSLLFSLPLLCLLTPPDSNFLLLLLQCDAAVAWLSDLAIVSHQW